METIIKSYIEKNQSTLYRDLPKIFGLSLDEITYILYGSKFYCLKNNLDLRIIDKKSRLYYFEKVEVNPINRKVTKYHMERNSNGNLTHLKRYDLSNFGNSFFDLKMDYDKRDRLISKKDSDGASLVVDYTEYPNIKCYMNDYLCRDVDKKMKWLKESFDTKQQSRLVLLAMDSDK